MALQEYLWERYLSRTRRELKNFVVTPDHGAVRCVCVDLCAMGNKESSCFVKSFSRGFKET